MTEELERLRSDDLTHPAVGWAVVPLEPTDEMLRAPDDAGVGLYSREVFATIYRAMLAAAPTPQATLSGGQRPQGDGAGNNPPIPDHVEAATKVFIDAMLEDYGPAKGAISCWDDYLPSEQASFVVGMKAALQFLNGRA